MNNKITATLLVILTVAVLFLFFQNFKLGKKVDELSVSNEVKITPVTSETLPANPLETSPFDKPNVDPLANQLSPESGEMSELTTIKFDKSVHDFGRIKEGAVAKTVFKFTNIGKNPLIISNAQGSCGCTVPKWPQRPVKPGETEEIAVEFNSEGKSGENEKTVTVTANTNPPTITLTIKSIVIPKDK